jgi:hypothetical protein
MIVNNNLLRESGEGEEEGVLSASLGNKVRW